MNSPSYKLFSILKSAYQTRSEFDLREDLEERLAEVTAVSSATQTGSLFALVKAAYVQRPFPLLQGSDLVVRLLEMIRRLPARDGAQSLTDLLRTQYQRERSQQAELSETLEGRLWQAIRTEEEPVEEEGFLDFLLPEAYRFALVATPCAVIALVQILQFDYVPEFPIRIIFEGGVPY